MFITRAHERVPARHRPAPTTVRQLRHLIPVLAGAALIVLAVSGCGNETPAHADGQNAVVVPCVETIYYGRQQNGYHGGATPQEMVCSLVVLTDKSSASSQSGIWTTRSPSGCMMKDDPSKASSSWPPTRLI